MPNTIVVGAQWGDEGKGKVVDYLTEAADVIIRAQGGSNAGHTVISEGQKYVLHLVPSGILWPGKSCVIGNGVALDPVALSQEIAVLESQGVKVSPERLVISERAHLTLPYHRKLDELREVNRGSKKLGTTGRGIGPTYADKAQRRGLRMVDWVDPAAFAASLRRDLEETNGSLQAAGMDPLPVAESCDQVLEAMAKLSAFMGNTIAILHEAMAEGKNLLFEGAQGTFLDLDFGTYPYVTSSNTTSGGACTGSGVPPNRIDRVIGVCKAYTTRVGTGPFPTENAEFGDYLHGLGREFGATTGRKRRCGWLDLVLLRQAVMINGIYQLAITNLDGLDARETIQVCRAYELGGKELMLPPARVECFEEVRPVYDVLRGWQTDLTQIKAWDDLPSAALNYLEYLEDTLHVKVSLVGVGPDRMQTLHCPRVPSAFSPEKSIRVRERELLA